MAGLTVTLTGIRNATFIAREVVSVEIPEGKGWAAEENGCSDFTKVMLIESSTTDNQNQIQVLRNALNEELAKRSKT